MTLTRILAVCRGAGGPEETVHLIRQRQHSFAPTMYSAWEREGQPLNPALRYELDLQRSRIELYREITAVIADVSRTRYRSRVSRSRRCIRRTSSGP